MKVGIAADHGGYDMKQKIYILLNAKGHQVVDFGNLQYDRDDDYPDFAIPLPALSPRSRRTRCPALWQWHRGLRRCQ